MTRMASSRLILLAASAALAAAAGAVPAPAADTVECSFNAKIGVWTYHSGDPDWLIITAEEPDIATELKSGDSLSKDATQAGHVDYQIYGGKTELQVKFRAVKYRGHESNFEALKDWKGFVMVLSVDGSELKRDPYRYDANTVMAWQPAEDLAAALGAGKILEFRLHDVGGNKDVVSMHIPLDGFAAAVAKAKELAASIKGALAAGKTCAPINW